MKLSQIKLGAIISYISIFINILIGLLYTPWMINKIGKADYGLYTLAMSVITLFVFDFGLSSAVTRFIAKYLAQKRQQQIDNLLGVVFKLYLIADIIILILLVGIYFFIPLIYQGLSTQEIEKFKIIYVIASIFSFISFPFIPLNGIFNAYEKYIQMKCCDLFHKLFIVSLMTICLLNGGGLYFLVIVNAISGILTIILKLFLLKKYISVKVNFSFWSMPVLRSIFGFSVWVTIIALSQRCIFNIAPSILGMVSNSSSIAILGVAIVIESYIFTFANAINGMFLPRVSRLVEDKNSNSLLPLMIKIGRIQIFIIGLLIISFIILGDEFIQLWVGAEFQDVYVASILFIIPAFLFIPQEIASSAVVAMNKVKYQAYVYIVMAVLNILLAFPLAYFEGILGLAISIFIAYLWRVVGMNIIYAKQIKIDLLGFYKASFMPVLIPLGIILIFGWLINQIYSDISWFSFIIKGIIVVCAYICIFVKMVMNQYEKNLFLSPFLSIYQKLK